MKNPGPCSASDFDRFAENYDEALQKGLAVTGEDKDYFARGRVDWLARRLGALSFQPGHILDFGCGTGSATPFLLQLPGATRLTGVEVSVESLSVARRLHGASGAEFHLRADFHPRGDVDLAFCNGVFHHISPAARPDAIELIYRSLRPGGLFVMWENNPWNPATRYIMHRIPFDRDAMPLSIRASCRLFSDVDFHIMHRDFLFIFPHCLQWFRRFEGLLSVLPLGGQYEIIGRKKT
jgi:SAM-dependent methyltransferase